jgi:hypothetical protein
MPIEMWITLAITGWIVAGLFFVLARHEAKQSEIHWQLYYAMLRKHGSLDDAEYAAIINRAS